MNADMTHSPPKWIIIWFIISTSLVFWDAGFCLNRPRSQFGGDLHWIWSPYGLYETIDLVYGSATYARREGFTGAQAVMNLVENAINITYLFLYKRSHPLAILFGYSAVLLTAWKTILYWLMDYMSGENGWSQTGHNTTRDWWILFALPNSFWVIVPCMIAYVFGKELAQGLRLQASNVIVASKGTKSKTK